MYSRPLEHRGGSNIIYEYYINGKKWNISNLNQYQQATVIGSTNYYIRLKNEKDDYWKIAALKNLSFLPFEKSRLFNTPENLTSHTEWMKSYIEKITHVEVENLIVKQTRYKHISKTAFEMKNSETIYQCP
jgi:hypothetical protein